MAQTDPHGWILAVVSVAVVFLCLLLLWGIYSLLGAIFSREPKARRTKKQEGPTPEECAAIAAALHLHFEGCAHDVEPGIITIKRTGASPWENKSLTLRRNPGTEQ